MLKADEFETINANINKIPSVSSISKSLRRKTVVLTIVTIVISLVLTAMIIMLLKATKIGLFAVSNSDAASTTRRPLANTPYETVMPTTQSNASNMLSNFLLNPGAEDFLSSWTQTQIASATTDNGTINSGYYQHSESKCFFGGYTSGTNVTGLLQNVNLLDGVNGVSPDQIDTGNLRLQLRFSYQNLNELPYRSDAVQVSIQFKSANNTIIGNVSTDELVCSTQPGWCDASYVYPLLIGSRSIDYIMNFIRYTGTSIDSYIDDNILLIF